MHTHHSNLKNAYVQDPVNQSDSRGLKTYVLS